MAADVSSTASYDHFDLWYSGLQELSRMDVRSEQLLPGVILGIAFVDIANTVFHVLAGLLLFAAINGVASLAALWSVWLIFLRSV